MWRDIHVATSVPYSCSDSVVMRDQRYTHHQPGSTYHGQTAIEKRLWQGCQGEEKLHRYLRPQRQLRERAANIHATKDKVCRDSGFAVSCCTPRWLSGLLPYALSQGIRKVCKVYKDKAISQEV
eukprot:853410-Pelagomonas_calceolata.AAC.1